MSNPFKKPPLDAGTYNMRLVKADYVKDNFLQVQCIFEPQDEFKAFHTVSRKISKHSPWADSSRPFIDQLEGFNHDNDLRDEIRRYIGQTFRCKVKEGKGWQRNITSFLAVANINSKTHVNYETFPNESQV